MKRELPVKHDRYKRILILCEGSEDEDYMNRLKSLGLWSDEIIVTVKNVVGIGNLADKYRDFHRAHKYSSIVVFCDTEPSPHGQFENVKEKILDYRRNDYKDKSVPWDKIIYYANPCTMQVVIMHLGYETLPPTCDKAKLSPTIKKYVRFEGTYSADSSQRQAIMNEINEKNYNSAMKKNINAFIRNRAATGDYTTNILNLFEALEGHNAEMSEEIFVR
ncbi:MAG: hypothetical protein LUD47_06155 [Clostridia bacterium]|nr:hypothetical protein [Clostridia bacterium]